MAARWSAAHGHRECPALDGPLRRGFQERRGGLVGRVGRGRPMPGHPIEVAHDTREGVVRNALILHGRPLLDRRPHQWVAEPKGLPLDLDELRVDRRLHCRRRDTGGTSELDDYVSALAARHRAQGPPTLLYVALSMLGYSALLQGKPDLADRFFDEAISIDVPDRTVR